MGDENSGFLVQKILGVSRQHSRALKRVQGPPEGGALCDCPAGMPMGPHCASTDNAGSDSEQENAGLGWHIRKTSCQGPPGWVGTGSGRGIPIRKSLDMSRMC